VNDTSHVIGWAILHVGLAADGTAWVVLTGSGYKGENPALYPDEASAQQAVNSQQGKGWFALPVLDQGDNT
jgi:hypothetical protein